MAKVRPCGGGPNGIPQCVGRIRVSVWRIVNDRVIARPAALFDRVSLNPPAGTLRMGLRGV